MLTNVLMEVKTQCEVIVEKNRLSSYGQLVTATLPGQITSLDHNTNLVQHEASGSHQVKFQVNLSDEGLSTETFQTVGVPMTRCQKCIVTILTYTRYIVLVTLWFVHVMKLLLAVKNG